MLKGFREFVLRGNALDLAVGGGHWRRVRRRRHRPGEGHPDAVHRRGWSGKPDFSAIVFTLHGSRMLIGDFINAVVSFVLIAAAVYFFVVLPMNAIVARQHRGEKPPDPTTKKCPECLSEIPIARPPLRVLHVAAALRAPNLSVCQFSEFRVDRRDQVFEIPRHRRFDANALARDRMRERQPPRVQRLPRKRAQRGGDRRVRDLHRVASPYTAIADERPAARREVDANLMRAAGLEPAPEQRQRRRRARAVRTASRSRRPSSLTRPSAGDRRGRGRAADRSAPRATLTRPWTTAR